MMVYTNPKTVAAAILVNGIESVRRSHRISPEVWREAMAQIPKAVLQEDVAASKPPKIQEIVAAHSARQERQERQKAENDLEAEIAAIISRGFRGLPPAPRIRRSECPKSPTERHDASRKALARWTGRPEFSAVNHLMKAVARSHNIEVSDLSSPKRERRVVVARACVAVVLFKAGFSYPEIGRRLGGRDHTTALHAIRRWPAFRPISREIRQAVVRHRLKSENDHGGSLS